MLSFGASIATGAIGAAGLLTTDIPRGGSLAFGAALAGSGLVFTAAAAVAAQLSPSARFTRGAAFTALAAAFTLPAGTAPEISTRLKMGQSSNVIAVVKADGKLYSATKETKVTLGGCGG